MRARTSRRLVSAAMVIGLGLAVSVAPGAQALSGGNAVPDGSYRFLARLTTGEGGCSGALIDPEFVITTSTCLPETGEVKIAVGDVNLATGAGHVTEAAKIVRHPSRDVAVVKLATRTTGITPIALSPSALTQGESLRVAGFGRSATEWVPDRPRVAAFTVAELRAADALLSGERDTCKGDAGGPAFREVDGTPQLVGLSTKSWQHGCLAVTETRKGSTETRVDDLVDWIRKQIVPTAVNCAPVQIWSVRQNGDLHRYVHHSAADGGLTWTDGTKVGNGWFGRMIAGPGNVVWDVHKRVEAGDPARDGTLKRWVWNNGSWLGGDVVGSGWELYFTPEYKNRITVDSQGRIIVIDAQGRLRYYVWDAARGTWANGAGETIEGGWDRFDSITAAGDGVLYARKTNGDMFRFAYDFAAKRFVQRDKPVGTGWQMFSEVFSPGGDILYGRGAQGKDPWGSGTVPVLRWYSYHDNVDSWEPGAQDGTGRSVGTGWDTERNVSAQAGACTLVK
ncbi:tachylectin-related carbohydrate-binding protein [Streptomyces scabiei]|uniref:tachylectin-related carbohydrate-binding protein n=1 Tax=Streptomyces scabiei TaxID=1930 RepID=UPI0029B7D951|nr:tachylectin-related carbohydrate-binding protein [Streptomyces scabiei]MDX3518254.1 tachylectin-related carbohydrate-binding protein [Streptomyces scabiei]